jgi:hypothetical protein
MARIEKLSSDKDRVCRMCEKPIARGETAYVFRGVHVPPKKKDLHMHVECLCAELHMADYR